MGEEVSCEELRKDLTGWLGTLMMTRLASKLAGMLWVFTTQMLGL